MPISSIVMGSKPGLRLNMGGVAAADVADAVGAERERAVGAENELSHRISTLSIPVPQGGRGGFVAVSSEEDSLLFDRDNGGTASVGLDISRIQMVRKQGSVVTDVSTTGEVTRLTSPDAQVETKQIALSAGAEDFTDLSDTPSSLGAAGQVVEVNEAGDGLKFGSKQETVVEAIQSTLMASLAAYTMDTTKVRMTLATLGGDHVAQGVTLAGNRITFAEKGDYRIGMSLHAQVTGSSAGSDRTLIDFFVEVNGAERDHTRTTIYHRGPSRTGISDTISFHIQEELLLEAGDIVDFFIQPDFEDATALTLTIADSATHIVSGEAIPIGSRTGATTFEALTDTPASLTGQGGKIVQVNAAGNALEFDDKPASGTDFTGLSDTPSAYGGNAGKVVEVNADGDGLTFGNKPPSVPADDTVTPAALDADAAVQQAAFRKRIEAASQEELFSRSAVQTVAEVTPYNIGTVLYGTGVILEDDPDMVITVEGHDTGLDLGTFTFQRNQLTTRIAGQRYSGAPRIPFDPTGDTVSGDEQWMSFAIDSNGQLLASADDIGPTPSLTVTTENFRVERYADKEFPQATMPVLRLPPSQRLPTTRVDDGRILKYMNGVLVPALEDTGLTVEQARNAARALMRPFALAETSDPDAMAALSALVDYNAIGSNRPDLTTYAQRAEILLPAYRKISGNESDVRFQGMLHSGGARQDAEVVFPEWDNVPRPVPPGQATPENNNAGSVSVLLRDGSRLTYFPSDFHTAALRGRYRLTPRSNFTRDFAPTQMEVSRSVDRAVTQEFGLTAGTGGTLVSEVATLDLQIPNTGRTVWVNFENADDNYYWTTPESQQPRYADADQLGRIIAVENRPTLESRSRPSGGWPASSTYVDFGRIPVRIAASLDDQLLLRVGYSAHTPYEIDGARNGGRVWGNWHRVQDLKNWPLLASGNPRGGEVYPPRWLNDDSADFRVPPNAELIIAHDILEFTWRIGADGYIHGWTDEWTRLSGVFVETAWFPWP